jgi:hypothetical protein
LQGLDATAPFFAGSGAGACKNKSLSVKKSVALKAPKLVRSFPYNPSGIPNTPILYFIGIGVVLGWFRIKIRIMAVANGAKSGCFGIIKRPFFA